MGSSVSRYVSAVKTSEIHITSVIIFPFGVHKGCRYARRVFVLRSRLCSCTFLPHLDTISFPNHTHTPIYVLPLTSLFNFFYSASRFPPFHPRMHFFGRLMQYSTFSFSPNADMIQPILTLWFEAVFFSCGKKVRNGKVRDLIDKHVRVWIKSAPSLDPAGTGPMK